MMKTIKEMNLEELTKLAESGNVEAQVELGKCYEFNLKGVECFDSVTAFSWFEKAAEQSYPDGIAWLAFLYYLGVGKEGKIVVKQDKEKAIEMWKKATEMGSEFAKEQLEKHLSK